jgi:hypothetical protein
LNPGRDDQHLLSPATGNDGAAGENRRGREEVGRAALDAPAPDPGKRRPQALRDGSSRDVDQARGSMVAVGRLQAYLASSRR